MAGQRRAQYVSIPLGPGVLSNPTGRGARTRINYMNWDRWFDSSWVRWHKLLPEKQGGWQYQALTSPQGAQIIPGSPILLLHMDTSAFADSSLYNWPMTAGPNTVFDTAAPKFAPGDVFCGTSPVFDGPVVYTPITQGSPLDLTNTPAWTMQGWIKIVQMDAFNQEFITIGESNGGFHQGVRLVCGGSGSPGSSDLTFQVFGEVSGPGASPSVPNVTQGVWHHFAMCKRPNQGGPAGDQYQLWVDGVGSGWSRSDIPFVGPYTQWAGYYSFGGYWDVVFGHWQTGTSGNNGVSFDEICVTAIDLYDANFTPPTAPSTYGLPNSLGTAIPPNGFVAATYVGIARDIHDWGSIDGQFWIAIGTNDKLYVVNQATLYDITPQRKTSNVMNAITTTNGSDVVLITDNDHRAATGDYIFITGATAVGGLTLAGNYQIDVLDPNTYTIFASSNATSGATGGGSFSIAYDIGAGLGANGELLGYGTGLYGMGTYGTPRAFGTGVFARMRTWSLDNYGQDLVASQSDGEIYYWARNDGPNSRAQLLTNAPTGCQRVLVDAQQQVIIALGCSDETGQYNAQLVRWSSFGDVNDWFPTDVNTAGDDILPSGSRIITGLKTKGQNLIFTDKTVYRMVFVGEPDIYDFVPAGDVTIVGPNACVDVDGVAYLMGFDNFYNYSGTLNLQACDVWETVYDPNFQTSINKDQAEGVVCYTYEPKTEVTWLYQSLAGAFTVTFTGGLSQGALSATLSTAWTGATDWYSLEFADQESQPVFLTSGQTTATWNQPLLTAVAGTATNIGNDRYVTFNWEDGVFYCGDWNRTCAAGRAPAMGGNPYGVNAGYLYAHEVGTDAIEARGTVAIGFFMRSLDITVGGAKSEYTMGGSDARFAVGGSDAHLLIRSLIPDWKTFTGTMNVTLLTKDRPQDPSYVQSGPVPFTITTDQIDIDAHGSQVVLLFDNLTNAGAPSLGCAFRMGILQGLATPYAKR